MNKVILLGRLTRDPESRMSSNNLEITRFSLACNSENVSRNSDNSTEFINCVAFGNVAGIINKYCVKGSSISVIGRIHNSSYTAQDGTKRYSTEVTVESFEFAGSNNRNQSSESNGYNNYNNNFNMNPEPIDNGFNSNDTVSYDDPYKDLANETTLSSDDLPF
ncbi:MAG: single-stranded DNA-binding protein [bacterium]